MKTNDLITNLSADLRPTRSGVFYLVSLLLWMFGTAVIVTAAFYFLPYRLDLPQRFQSVPFQAETLLSLAVFFMAVLIAYRSAVPGLLQARHRQIGWALFLILSVILLSQLSVAGLKSEFLGELDFYRGRCGPIMLIIGTLEIGLLMFLARRGAPTKPAMTGVWIALSAGAMGLFVMQFVCNYENFLHVLMWHFIPIGLLLAAGTFLGRRLLKW